MTQDIHVPLTADQVAQIVAYDDDAKRASALRDATIRGIALGQCSAQDLAAARIRIVDDAIIISMPEAAP